MDLFSKINIPIPKSDEKLQEWVDKISKPFNNKQKYETELKDLEKNIQDKIKNISENEECDIVKLGDICDIWCGKNLPKKKAINGKYSVYGGGSTSYTHNEYNLQDFNIIISRVGNNNIIIINDKIYLTDNGFALIIEDVLFKKYIGYNLLNNKDIILNIGNGSAQKVISKTDLNNINISIPKDKELIDNLEPSFSKIEKLQEKINKNDNLYKKYVKELSDEAIIGYE